MPPNHKACFAPLGQILCRRDWHTGSSVFLLVSNNDRPCLNIGHLIDNRGHITFIAASPALSPHSFAFVTTFGPSLSFRVPILVAIITFDVMFLVFGLFSAVSSNLKGLVLNLSAFKGVSVVFTHG